MKTLWQRVYGFCGFWTYQEITFRKAELRSYLVIYFCLWPWKFQRKIDILRIDRTKQYRRDLKKTYARIADSMREELNQGM